MSDKVEPVKAWAVVSNLDNEICQPWVFDTEDAAVRECALFNKDSEALFEGETCRVIPVVITPEGK